MSIRTNAKEAIFTAICVARRRVGSAMAAVSAEVRSKAGSVLMSVQVLLTSVHVSVIGRQTQ